MSTAGVVAVDAASVAGVAAPDPSDERVSELRIQLQAAVGARRDVEAQLEVAITERTSMEVTPVLTVAVPVAFAVSPAAVAAAVLYNCCIMTVVVGGDMARAVMLSTMIVLGRSGGLWPRASALPIVALMHACIVSCPRSLPPPRSFLPLSYAQRALRALQSRLEAAESASTELRRVKAAEAERAAQDVAAKASDSMCRVLSCAVVCCRVLSCAVVCCRVLSFVVVSWLFEVCSVWSGGVIPLWVLLFRCRRWKQRFGVGRRSVNGLMQLQLTCGISWRDCN